MVLGIYVFHSTASINWISRTERVLKTHGFRTRVIIPIRFGVPSLSDKEEISKPRLCQHLYRGRFCGSSCGAELKQEPTCHLNVLDWIVFMSTGNVER